MHQLSCPFKVVTKKYLYPNIQKIGFILSDLIQSMACYQKLSGAPALHYVTTLNLNPCFAAIFVYKPAHVLHMV